MHEILELKAQNFTFMGKNATIQGHFILKGPTHISSHITGDITMENSAWLCIEKYGEVIGNILGHDIEIYGTVKGSIKATGVLTLHPPARIEGHIDCQGLIVHPGAQLDSDLSVSSETKTPITTNNLT